ncbi:MAG: hypothetical protein V1872_10675 [bacterium]
MNYEQRGKTRAEYGEKTLAKVSKKLIKDIGIFCSALLLLINACSINTISNNTRINKIKYDYQKQIKQNGWQDIDNKNQTELLYYHDQYKSYISIYIEQIVRSNEQVDWKKLNHSLINDLARASKLKIEVTDSDWEKINDKKLLRINARGKKAGSPDFMLRIYWLQEDRILYKCICIGPENYWPKVLFDFVGLINYFTSERLNKP